MANFKSFADLHDYNRKLQEDDWNNGQHFQFKLKNSIKNGAGSFDNAATLKVAHSQPGEAHTAKFENKVTGKSTEFGGIKMECKATNDGKIAFKNELNGLFKDVEGFENAVVHMEGSLKKGAADWGVGFSHSGKDHKFQLIADAKREKPNFNTETVWRPCNWMVIAEKARFDTTFKDTDFEVLTNVSFPGTTGFQTGTRVKGVHTNGLNFSNLTSTGNVVHTAGNNTAGIQLDYNYSNNTIKSQIGFENKQDDHTWKFIAHSSGTARALLQWQLHRCCKANVNTSIDLGEISQGRIAPFPWGVGFEVKY